MEKIIIISFVVTALFCAVKFVELRVLYKPPAVGPGEEAPAPPSLKPIFRDGILVFVCSVCASFFIEQITPSVMTMMGGISTGEILDGSSPKVFTGQPGF